MSKHHEKALGFACILSALTGGLDVYLSRRTGMLIFPALLPFAAVSTLVCGLVWLRMRLARLSLTELRNERLAMSERPDASLFSGGEEEESAPLTVERSRQQFERVMVPIFTVLLIVLEAGWATWLLQQLKVASASAVVKDPLLSTTFLLGQGFILFLSSRYLSGLGREKRLRLFRGPGIATGLLSLLSFVTAIMCLLSMTLNERAIVIGSYVLVVGLFVIAGETLLNLIVAFYSPRRKFLTGVAYESRLANVVTDPARVAENVAQTVDYQFGLDVSQNWYTRMVKSTVIPLVATSAILVYLLTAVVVLGPEEQGILEQFGKPAEEGWLLDSGLHVKKPWPFETVKRIPSKRIQRVDLGFVAKEAHEEGEEDQVLVWTRAHYKEESRFLVYNPLAGERSGSQASATGRTAATPVGFLNANMPLQYEVKDLKAYAYNYAAPMDMVAKTATRVLTQEMASRTLRDLLVADRTAVSEQLHQRVQAEFDRLELGVAVRFIGIFSMHPPVEVGRAYEGVVDAISEKETRILEARTYEEKVLPQARADSERLIQEASAYRAERKALASAEATHFEGRLAAFEQGGDVFKMRAYLAAMQAAYKGARKFVVDADGANEVINFNGSSGMDIPSALLDEETRRGVRAK